MEPAERIAHLASAVGARDPLRALAAITRRRSLRDAVGDRRVLITGASSGIGEDLATRVGRAGGHVLLVSRRREVLEDVAADVEDLGGVASVHPADLADGDDAARVAEEIVAEHGGVDILINNAGHSIRRSLKRSYDRPQDFERTMALNYFGAMRLMLVLLPGMCERHDGHVVNISTVGLTANAPLFPAYLASKAALDALTKSIGPELIRDGVQVTTVFMPLTRTPMIEPTEDFENVPAISVRQASAMVAEALIDRPREVNSMFGRISRTLYQLAPGQADRVVGATLRP